MKGGALQRDPEKVRAWNEKHRKAFAPRGAALQPRGGLKRSGRASAPRIPTETRAAARARSGGKCVVCVHEGHRRPGKAEHLHHVFPKQENRWPGLALVEDGLVGVCEAHHSAHEFSPDFRIPLLALPECVFRLAADVGPAAVDYLLTTYDREEHPCP